MNLSLNKFVIVQGTLSKSFAAKTKLLPCKMP